MREARGKRLQRVVDLARVCRLPGEQSRAPPPAAPARQPGPGVDREPLGARVPREFTIDIGQMYIINTRCPSEGRHARPQLTRPPAGPCVLSVRAPVGRCPLMSADRCMSCVGGRASAGRCAPARAP